MHLYPSSPYKEQTCSTYFYTNLQIWHTMNKIRLLTKGELPKAIELSWQVFTITSKEDFNDEGLEFFKSFIYNEKYIDEITFYGSFNNKVLTGILGIKNNGKHISLFFIKPEYHRQGLGKTLFHYVFALHPSIETTVNSSTYAIPFYQSLGFAVVGEKQNYHGLCSTPMRRYHAVFVQKNKYTLRTWQTEDAHSLVQELNNKKIWDNCRNVFPHPYRLEHAETFIDLIKKKEGIHDFCIEVNGKAVGNIGFIPGTDVECFNAEVGYVIGEKYWNQGIVTDALQEAIYHYFTYTNTIRIFALVFEHNFPSMRVLEKAGFNKVGIMTTSIFKNGHFTNAHLFELLKNT